ncbi:MAG TPA: diacylglycerol kinase family protein [Chthonomonadaceae bacterium]|nr:diacylglycerol kinase family protein [Chthonomonadaceae bacterium]
MTAIIPTIPTAIDRETRGARRCLILANPKAGGLQFRELFAALPGRMWRILRRLPAAEADSIPSSLPLLAAAAAEAGLEANVEPVPPPAQLPALLRSAEAGGFDTIVAVGGDGTVRNIAQHLVGSSLRLGILPMGTANNVAHALGIPFDLAGALRVLVEGVERRMDVGHIGKEYFLEAAGVGLFADAIQAFGPEEPRNYQLWRLLKVCGPLCWNPTSRHLRLTVDGNEFQEEVLMLAVANAAYLGAGMEMAPGARLSDGLFDVILVGAMTRWELMRFARALRSGRHLDLPKVHRLQARAVAIRRIHRSHRPLPVHADDHIVAYTPATIEIVPGALRVLAPSFVSNTPSV